MARSAIIKDLANSTVDTMTALKRAKVLFAELGNDDLLEWVSYEIAGYPADANLPDYRKVRGRLVGSYIKGSMASHMKWTNVSLPLGTMPDEIQEALLSVYFREGVGALGQLAESSKEDGQLGKTIDADFFRPLQNTITIHICILHPQMFSLVHSLFKMCFRLLRVDCLMR